MGVGGVFFKISCGNTSCEKDLHFQVMERQSGSLSAGLLPTPTAPPALTNSNDEDCSLLPPPPSFDETQLRNGHVGPPASLPLRSRLATDDLSQIPKTYIQHLTNRTHFSLLVISFCIAGFLAGCVSVALSIALPTADNFVSSNSNLFGSPFSLLLWTITHARMCTQFTF